MSCHLADKPLLTERTSNALPPAPGAHILGETQNEGSMNAFMLPFSQFLATGTRLDRDTAPARPRGLNQAVGSLASCLLIIMAEGLKSNAASSVLAGAGQAVHVSLLAPGGSAARARSRARGEHSCTHAGAGLISLRDALLDKQGGSHRIGRSQTCDRNDRQTTRTAGGDKCPE